MGGKGSGRKTGGTKKDPFEALPEEFKDSVLQGSEDSIREKLADVALAQQELLEAQENDTDYQSAKETAQAAGEVYRDGKKSNSLKIKYMRQVLQSRGKL